MIRLWHWFLRRPAPELLCRHCAVALDTCDSCDGAWRSGPCRVCGTGLRCPTHRAYWHA